MSADDTRGRRMPRVLALALFVLVTFSAAGVGSLFTMVSVEGWYVELVKPTWTPPAWVFGPVWTVLYAMMAVAGWLVWRQHDSARRTALWWFGVQLVLNIGWSAIFFGLRLPGLAFFEIATLWLAIAATILTAARVSRAAAILLAPYLLWVSFALALNAVIWRLNA